MKQNLFINKIQNTKKSNLIFYEVFYLPKQKQFKLQALSRCRNSLAPSKSCETMISNGLQSVLFK